MDENIQVKNRKVKVDTMILALKKAKNQKKTVVLGQFLAVLGLNLGVSKLKMLEYVEYLSDAKLIDVNHEKDTIKWIGEV